MQKLDRRGESVVPRGRVAVLPWRHPSRLGDFQGDFGAGQDAAVARLGALRQLDFYHLDAVLAGAFGEGLFRETAFGIAAAEIARTNVPDQVALVLKMIATDAAFTSIVRELAQIGAFV